MARKTTPWLTLLAALLAMGCDDGETGCVPGMGRICPGGSDSGPNPRMDAGPLPPGVDGGNRDAGPRFDGSPACVESWTCTPWETDGTSDAATRSCVDANGCGTTFMQPAQTTTLPALDRDFYECNVEPILDRGCAQLACHGTENGRALRVYHRGRLRITTVPSDPPSEQLHELSGCLGNPSVITAPQDCIGSLECECWQLPHTPRERIRNFDAARGFGLDSAGTPLTDQADSELLTQPEIGGGFPHQNIHFWSSSDADYQTILSWLNGATLGRTCNLGN
ncbi:MAG: hypothetical protein AB7S26_37375 [Sandaracinaceae bacterium]